MHGRSEKWNYSSSVQLEMNPRRKIPYLQATMYQFLYYCCEPTGEQHTNLWDACGSLETLPCSIQIVSNSASLKTETINVKQFIQDELVSHLEHSAYTHCYTVFTAIDVDIMGIKSEIGVPRQIRKANKKPLFRCSQKICGNVFPILCCGTRPRGTGKQSKP